MNADQAAAEAERCLDALAATANGERTAEGMARLWSAAFSSESWTLIGRKGAHRFEPLTTTYENLMCVLAFTSHARACILASDQGLEDGSGPLAGRSVPAADKGRPVAELISMPVPAAVDLLDELRSVGVECVLFNEGSGPFVTPLSELLRLFARHGMERYLPPD